MKNSWKSIGKQVKIIAIAAAILTAATLMTGCGELSGIKTIPYSSDTSQAYGSSSASTQQTATAVPVSTATPVPAATPATNNNYTTVYIAPAQQPAAPPAQAPAQQPPAQNYKSSSGSGYLYPSNTRYITAGDLDGRSQTEVRLILNEIYARHGYIFSDDYYRNYFSSRSWYRGTTTSADAVEGYFNSVERSNKETIAAYEKARGWR